MSGDFLDTNIFVYLFDEADQRKHLISRAIVGRGLDDGSATISFQVVQETLSVITGKLRVPVQLPDAREFLASTLAPLWTVQPQPALYARALELRERYGFSFYDSLIVAAAFEAGCDRILSEDLQHGQRIETLVIENPFRE